jgi:Nucleotidyl transferase AbiEii toxin, Type IV TA system
VAGPHSRAGLATRVDGWLGGAGPSPLGGDRSSSGRPLRVRAGRRLRRPGPWHPGPAQRGYRPVHAWERRDEFASAVDAIVNGYRDGGYTVEITQQFDTFARLAVTDPALADHAYKVELAANWRALPPVMMDVGPVLHVDDVVAGKMSALYTRGEPRDFLDIDAALTSGRYTRDRLCELAEQADSGFDRRILADLFGMLERYPDRRFAAYGADPTQITAMRKRFRQWREQLLTDEA